MTEVLPATTMTPDPSPPRPARLTPRDVAMMASISTARYLTAEALEWLHVPTWPTRWDRYQTAPTRRARYYPSTALYRRLAFLVSQGWIYRMKRSVQTGLDLFLPEPDMYGLLEEGALIVAAYERRPVATVAFDRKRPRSYYTLSHAVAIGQVYAALRAKIERHPGLALADWRGDHLTAKAYDRITVRRIGRRGDMETVLLPVQPDASFTLVHPGGRDQFFIEVDRGTRATATWVEKIQAYAAYTKSPELKARYGVATFHLLTVTPDQTVQQRLMQATASVLGKPHGRYLFALQGQVHPTTIGTAWTKVTSVTPSGNPTRPTITTEAHTLIQ